MKSVRAFFAAVVVLLIPVGTLAGERPKDSGDKIRVLMVTGGHDFEKEPFFKMFKDNPDITYQAFEHPNAHRWLKVDVANRYDVLVLYEMIGCEYTTL